MAKLRLLFVHQNFPGQFKHLAPWLVSQGHEVIGMGDAENLKSRNAAWTFPVVGYTARPAQQGAGHHYLRSFEAAIRRGQDVTRAVSYTHLRAHETVLDLVCRLLLEKKKTQTDKEHVDF